MTHYRKPHPPHLPPYGVLPSEAYIRAILDYNPHNGFLSWARRPPELCSPAVDARGKVWNREEAAKWFNTNFANKQAGTKSEKWSKATGIIKYPSVKLNGVNVPASHVCWFLHYGEWPKSRLSNIDGNPGNLKIANLKETGMRFHPCYNSGAFDRAKLAASRTAARARAKPPIYQLLSDTLKIVAKNQDPDT